MADRLDQRLAGALRQAADGPSVSSEDLAVARAALVGALRRRRARRRAQGLALLAVVVLGAGSWVAVRWWPSVPGNDHSTAATAGPARGAGAAPGSPRATCARVVGTSRCVGTVSTATKSPAELAPDASGPARFGAATTPGAGPGQTLDLRAGHAVTLVLPSGAGRAWSQPGVARSAPTAGGPVVRIGRVARVRHGGSARSQTVTVAGVRPGTVPVVARATCGAGAARSSCAAREWTVEVVVSS